MPYLRITTSQTLPAEKKAGLLKTFSSLTAKALGKPEGYVMVSLESSAAMLFAGSTEPCALLELFSIGLTEDKTPLLAAALGELAEKELNVRQDRAYIFFNDLKGKMVGWNGGTC